MFGLTEGSIMDSGRATTCRVTVFTYTQMEFAMTGSTQMIRRMVTDFTIGLMVVNMRAGGVRASNMDSVFT
jgi:hypothetical protein